MANSSELGDRSHSTEILANIEHAMKQPNWVPAFPFNELAIGRGRVFKAEGRQAAVFRLDETTVYAVDNLCPHEGYPLAQGYLKDCVLTCAWHNYKFDLRDGAFVQGDEDLATYPTDFVDGEVMVAIGPRETNPAEIGRLHRSLREGLAAGDSGRISRDVVRLLRAVNR